MGNLIIGVIMDILIHVFIEDLNGGGIGRVPSSPWDFGVLDSAKFVVLLPQIGFDEFCCRQEPKNIRVSPRETATRSAVGALANSPAPMVPAPTASDLPKKERRLIKLFKDLTLSATFLS